MLYAGNSEEAANIKHKVLWFMEKANLPYFNLQYSRWDEKCHHSCLVIKQYSYQGLWIFKYIIVFNSNLYSKKSAISFYNPHGIVTISKDKETRHFPNLFTNLVLPSKQHNSYWCWDLQFFLEHL